MLSAHDVAAYIVEDLGPVTPMKLQKLLYYCQAWHLVCRAEPLFAEPILAWDHGPVVEEVWRVSAGSRELVSAWPQGLAAAVEGKSEEVVRAALAQYGSLTAAQLRNLSHSESLWTDARASDDQVIAPAAMRAFFAEMLDGALDLRLAEQAERSPGELVPLDEVAAELGWW